MKEHTPGPWRIEADAASDSVIYVTSDSNGICALLKGTGDKADAALIAAAPDLLEIIELALAWCEQDAENEDGYPTQEMMDNRVAVLRAAIEAVQGGEE